MVSGVIHPHRSRRHLSVSLRDYFSLTGVVLPHRSRRHCRDSLIVSFEVDGDDSFSLFAASSQ